MIAEALAENARQQFQALSKMLATVAPGAPSFEVDEWLRGIDSPLCRSKVKYAKTIERIAGVHPPSTMRAPTATSAPSRTPWAATRF